MKKLDPNWICGFVDGEWTFYVWINKQASITTWFQVLPEFRVVQHKRDIQLLNKLKSYFSCWVVRVNHSDRYEYRVRSLNHIIEIIIPFFEKYPLQTVKNRDFYSFRRIINKMKSGRHMTTEWIHEILHIAKLMNIRNKEKTIKNVLG